MKLCLGAALNNPVSRVARSGIRMAGDALGQGDAMDAMDNAIRGVTGDRSQINPSSYSGSGIKLNWLIQLMLHTNVELNLMTQVLYLLDTQTTTTKKVA